MSADQARICVIDLETTGLTPPGLAYHDAGHEAWEFGLIVRDVIQLLDDASARKRTDTEHLYRIKPDLAKADPQALRANRYYERTRQMAEDWTPGVCRDLAHWPSHVDGSHPLPWSDPFKVARKVAETIDGAVVLGANPGFDKDFVRPFLARHGQAYTAHYRPLCITTMGYGYLHGLGKADGLTWPLSSDEVSRALGVDPGDFGRHTALGDCAWTLAQFDVISGGAR